ncbi:BH0509 family protein [Pullulanibacillus sp. KACC 23026]|nr:BH0509 family protein [Pullulanibacillus sp. KACC 23026]WEG12190.1 BH0509 family protein [Pullulanibacillus sp. KACC 23026]
MSQSERNQKVRQLIDKNKFNEKEILKMTDGQIDYYHWLYFVDSVYDYM